MHLKSLRVYVDVINCKSFSRAAVQNGVSQSGVSQIVHQLEENLGVKLIDRSKRPFVLTNEGELFYQGCRKILARYEALEEEVRTLHRDVAGRVSVASIYSIGLNQLNRYVQQFLRLNPKANVRLEYQHPTRVVEYVENDRVDVGMVSYPKSTRNIRATLLQHEPVVLVCSPEHPFASADKLNIRQLHGHEFVGFDDGLKIRRDLDRAFGNENVEPKHVMEFDNIETIKRAVEINAGISLLPEPTVQREIQMGTLKSIEVEDLQLTRPVGMIVRHGNPLGKTALRFIQLLQETWTQNGFAPSENSSVSEPQREAVHDES